jgi:hypothetical protein
MGDLLAWIEGLPPAAALRTSFVAYPLVNAAHILAIGMLVTSVLVMHWALLVPRRSLPEDMITLQLRPVALAAFLVAALTGFALFSIRAAHYAGNPAFLVKLGLIGAAILNFTVFVALARSGASERTRRASAVLSSTLWISALVAGRFIGFIE